MMRLFKFDTLITPSIIKFIFFFNVVIYCLTALGIVFQGLSLLGSNFFEGIAYIIGAVILLLLLTLISRIGAELVLVVFMIRDELAWQRQNRR